jgi:peptidoglycan/xylan/chitin deacetylase (PgdA/CDA1 family)
MPDSAINHAVLAYHEVMPESDYSYCVTSSALAEHLALFDSVAKNGGFKPPVYITFDDGERSQYLNAAPLLAEYGISATYFVTPGLIGTAAKFLGWDELKALQRAGHSIQSHGWSHKFLTFCSDAELAHELLASRKLLEDKLGTLVEEISVPGGRWNWRVIKACADAGYRRVYVSDPWVAENMFGIQVIGRFMVRRSTTATELLKMIQQDQYALGDGLYYRLWCRLTGYNEFEAARQQGPMPERKI